MILRRKKSRWELVEDLCERESWQAMAVECFCTTSTSMMVELKMSQQREEATEALGQEALNSRRYASLLPGKPRQDVKMLQDLQVTQGELSHPHPRL